MNKRGHKEEDQACRYLQKKGYKIVARNWLSPFGEIDIIARDGDTLTFVEVKARHGGNFVKAEEALTVAKRKRIIATARLYLSRMEIQVPVRFDFVAICDGKVTLYENAFQVD